MSRIADDLIREIRNLVPPMPDDMPERWMGAPCYICGKPEATGAARREMEEEDVRGEFLCWNADWRDHRDNYRVYYVGDVLILVQEIERLRGLKGG
ncbi:MAG: hypothetical protein KatS3mg087_1820 [Patescibacteria group bacterium]|nr:MAG: hypothetical protein KatS3mg087_1820 [Patescibacteria group bacterium]